MEPWKTNLEPSKLTWSCTGWLWGVQVVTGDSQEEVIIFRYTQTELHHNIYIIITIITIITITIRSDMPAGWCRARCTFEPQSRFHQSLGSDPPSFSGSNIFNLSICTYLNIFQYLHIAGRLRYICGYEYKTNYDRLWRIFGVLIFCLAELPRFFWHSRIILLL